MIGKRSRLTRLVSPVVVLERLFVAGQLLFGCEVVWGVVLLLRLSI
jgi:hypothetical protein